MNLRVVYTPTARGANVVRVLRTDDPSLLGRRTIVFPNGTERKPATWPPYRQHVERMAQLTTDERARFYETFLPSSASKPSPQDRLFALLDVMLNAEPFAELDLVRDIEPRKIVRRLRTMYSAAFERRQLASQHAVAFLRDKLARGPQPKTLVERDASVAGIKRTTLRLASSIVGVISRRAGTRRTDPYVWSLPTGRGSIAQLDT